MDKEGSSSKEEEEENVISRAFHIIILLEKIQQDVYWATNMEGGGGVSLPRRYLHKYQATSHRGPLGKEPRYACTTPFKNHVCSL